MSDETVGRIGVLAVNLDCERCGGDGRAQAGLCPCVRPAPVYATAYGTEIGGPLTARDGARGDERSTAEPEYREARERMCTAAIKWASHPRRTDLRTAAFDAAVALRNAKDRFDAEAKR